MTANPPGAATDIPWSADHAAADGAPSAVHGLQDKAATAGHSAPRIVVVGVGGAGCNAVNNMIEAHLEGVEFVVATTCRHASSKPPWNASATGSPTTSRPKGRRVFLGSPPTPTLPSLGDLCKTEQKVDHRDTEAQRKRLRRRLAHELPSRGDGSPHPNPSPARGEGLSASAGISLSPGGRGRDPSRSDGRVRGHFLQLSAFSVSLCLCGSIQPRLRKGPPLGGGS